MARKILRIVLAIIYFGAGVLHLWSPDGFLAIMPKAIPYPAQIVAFTGVAEIAGAIGLLTPRFRWAAGIGLAIYALCVWPANINHAVNNIALGGSDLTWWYHGPRLLFQPVIIWLALWVGCVVDWPFRKTV